MLLGAYAGCTSGREEVPGEAPAMSIFTKAPASPLESGTDSPCRVVFIRKDRFGDVGGQGFKPFHEAWFSSMNTYSVANGRYNTMQSYPANNSYVYVSGYAPADEHETSGSLLRMNSTYDNVEVNYEGDYDNSVWAGIAVADPVRGNAINPFINDDQVLEFHYATIRLRFRAWKAETMDNVGVYNVKVGIRPEHVPVSLKWDSYVGGYTPQGDGATAMNLDVKRSGNTLGQMYFKEDESNMNWAGGDESHYFYVCRDRKDITVGRLMFDISADYTTDLNYADESKKTHVSKVNVPVYLQDHVDGDVVNILPGDSYLITIIFDLDTFTLVAEEEDWEDGGQLVIPVPNPVPIPE